MSELNIKIRKLQDNGSTFRATPESLYMGGVGSAKVDTLCFDVPEEWKGCAITLHVQRLSGALPDPQLLDEKNRAVVDQRWTKEQQGPWMLMAVGADGYTAMTKPGRYTCYETIDRDSTTEAITPSVYEQFVALVKKETAEAKSVIKLITGTKKEVIDLSSCETGKGRISKNVGDDFSFESSTAWIWYSFDCQKYSRMSANLRCYSVESNYKNIVFVDSNNKIVGTENNIGPEGNVLTSYHLFESIVVPFDAVKCYVLSYMNAVDVKIYGISNSSVFDDLKKYNYDDALLKIQKSKFDNQFLYISYSQISGLNSSINKLYPMSRTILKM